MNRVRSLFAGALCTAALSLSAQAQAPAAGDIQLAGRPAAPASAPAAMPLIKNIRAPAPEPERPLELHHRSLRDQLLRRPPHAFRRFRQRQRWLLRRPPTEGQGRLGRVQLRPVAEHAGAGRLEFGADALGGYHADEDTRWSEEYQDLLYINQFKMLSALLGLRGMTPWILVDFRSPRRPHPQFQDFWNRMGLISDSGKKKKAFFTLKNYYDDMQRKYK
jgi:hypothetical protein